MGGLLLWPHQQLTCTFTKSAVNLQCKLESSTRLRMYVARRGINRQLSYFSSRAAAYIQLPPQRSTLLPNLASCFLQHCAMLRRHYVQESRRSLVKIKPKKPRKNVAGRTLPVVPVCAKYNGQTRPGHAVYDNTDDGPKNTNKEIRALLGATFIAFDLETTGYNGRIVEIAARDAAGGEGSSMESRVNPRMTMDFGAEKVTKIYTRDVNAAHIPEWDIVGRAFIDFVESRRNSNKPIILVAHNGKSFDVERLKEEFARCGIEKPHDWLFLDTRHLATKVYNCPKAKAAGVTAPMKETLTYLYKDHFQLPDIGEAHSAMVDVNMLLEVFEQLLLTCGKFGSIEKTVSSMLFDFDKNKRPLDTDPVEELCTKADVAAGEAAMVETEVEAREALERVEESLGLGKCTGADLSGEEDFAVGLSFRATELEEASAVSEAGTGGSQTEGRADQDLILGTESGQLQNGAETEVELGLRLLTDVNTGEDHTISRPMVELGVSGRSNQLPQLNGHLAGVSDFGKDEDTVRDSNGSLIFSPDALPEKKTTSFLPAGKATGPSALQEVDQDEVVPGEVVPGLGAVDENQLRQGIAHSLGSEVSSTNQVPLLSKGKALGDWRNLQSQSVDSGRLSGAMRQWVETKALRPHCLLLAQVGDRYEAYFEDAVVLARELGMRLSKKDAGRGLLVPMVAVSCNKLNQALPALVARGLSVALNDEVRRGRGGGYQMQRQVSTVLTPGTILDPNLLPARGNNFLLSLVADKPKGEIGLAYADVSTGEFWATVVKGEVALKEEVLRLDPVEVLVWPREECFPEALSAWQSSSAAWSRGQRAIRKPVLMRQTDYEMRQAGGILGPFGDLPERLLAEKAASMLSRHVEDKCRPSASTLLQDLRWYSLTDAMHLDATARAFLQVVPGPGLPQESLQGAIDRTLTPMGARLLHDWLLRPSTNRKDLETRLEVVDFLAKRHHLRDAICAELAELPDVARLASRLAWGKADAQDVVAMAGALSLLENGDPQRKTLSLVSLLDDVDVPWDLPGLLRQRLESLQEPFREMEGLFEEQLDHRTDGVPRVAAGKDSTLDALRNVVAGRADWQKDMETRERLATGNSSLEVRSSPKGGHYVVSLGYRLKASQVPLDYIPWPPSSSPPQQFTSPSMMLEEGGLVLAREKAAQREEEVVREAAQRLAEHVKAMWNTSELLATLDVLASFAEVAAERGYTRPQLSDSGPIIIHAGRHALLDVMVPEGVPVIPNSTFLGARPAVPILGEGKLSRPTSEDSWPNVHSHSKSPNEVASFGDTGSFSHPRDVQSEAGTSGRHIWYANCAAVNTWQSSAQSSSAAELPLTTNGALANSVPGDSQPNSRHESDPCSLWEKDKWDPAVVFLLAGPRGSGKTCYLHQLGLIQILAQVGSLVPAKAASLPITDAIWVCSDTSRNKNLRSKAPDQHSGQLGKILTGATEKSLVLIDEEWSHWDLLDESSDGGAVVDHLASIVEARTLIATEYDEKKEMEGLDLPNTLIGYFRQVKTTAGEWRPDFALQVGRTQDSPSSLQAQNSERPEAFERLGLDDIWWQVIQVLKKNHPATEALARQKGRLVHVDRFQGMAKVAIQAERQFVGRFESETHRRGLEEAFQAVLNTSVQVVVKQ